MVLSPPVSLKMQILIFYTNKYLLDFFLKEFCLFRSFLNSLIINNLSGLYFSCKQSCVLQNESFAYLFLPNSCASVSFSCPHPLAICSMVQKRSILIMSLIFKGVIPRFSL